MNTINYLLVISLIIGIYNLYKSIIEIIIEHKKIKSNETINNISN